MANNNYNIIRKRCYRLLWASKFYKKECTHFCEEAIVANNRKKEIENKYNKAIYSLEWLLNVVSGVGIGGGTPSQEELEDSFEMARELIIEEHKKHVSI